MWLALRDRLGADRRSAATTTLETVGEVLALVKDGAEVEAAEAGETVRLLFDRTPFYAESGGQAGDRGEIDWPGGRGRGARHAEGGRRPARARAEDHSRAGSRRGQRVHLTVDAERRAAHPAQPLRRAPGARGAAHVLGPHVAQKGQLVDGDRMRFDFSHGGAADAPTRSTRIETEVNAVIRQNLPAADRGDGARRRRSRPAPSPCSARSTATASAC